MLSIGCEAGVLGIPSNPACSWAAAAFLRLAALPSPLSRRSLPIVTVSDRICLHSSRITRMPTAFHRLKDNISTHVWADEKVRRDDSDVATDMNYSVASSLSWSKFIYNLETCMRIRGPPKTTASFKRWTPWTVLDKSTCTYIPQGLAPRFPDGWLKISGSPKYPHHDCMDHRW